MRTLLSILILAGCCVAQAASPAENLCGRLHAAQVVFDAAVNRRGVTPDERTAAVAKLEAALKPILTDVRAYRKTVLPQSTVDEDKRWDDRFANESPINQANGLERYLRKLETRK